MRALGRCARKHAQVVEYVDGALPTGACAKQDKDGKPCGELIVEWALKPAKENAR